MEIIGKNFGNIFKEPFLYYEGLVLDGDINKIFYVNEKLVILKNIINPKEVYELIINNNELPKDSILNKIGDNLFFNVNNSTIYLNYNDGIKLNNVENKIYFNQSNKKKFITFKFWKHILLRKYKLTPEQCEKLTKEFANDIIEKFK